MPPRDGDHDKAVLIRPYDAGRDFDAVLRVWKEVGWFKKDKEDWFGRFVTCGRAWVAEVGGQAECTVTTAAGTICYLGEILPFATLTGVAAGRTVRKKGLTSRTTAQAVAADVADGALVHGVWIFDQGFYSRLGYGNWAYEHWVSLDPDSLTVEVPDRVPVRIGKDQVARAHAARLPDPKPDWDF